MPKVSAEHLAARRRQILEAAAGAFSERGFARTSMADIVRATGLSNGAVYRYFPSKADLVLAIVDGREGRVEGEYPDETAGALLRRLAGYVAPPTGAAHARLVAQIWGDAAVIPELAAVARASHEQLQGRLAELLGAGAAAPDPEEDAATSQVVLAALVGYAALAAADMHVDTERFLRTLEGLITDR